MDNYGMNALYLSCISLVFVAGFNYWSIQLHPLNLLATWFTNSEWWKRLNLICFEGGGGEMSKPLYLCRRIDPHTNKLP